MTKTQLIAEIKESISCIELLEPSKNKMYCCPCPDCGSGHGENHTGAVKYYPDTNTWFCHACDTGGDVIDLYQIINDCDFNTAVNEMAADLGLQIDDYSLPEYQNRRTGRDKVITHTQTQANGSDTPAPDYSTYYQECDKYRLEPDAATYLKSRGISTSNAINFGIGYDPKERRIIIPNSKSSYTARAIDHDNKIRYKNPKGAPIDIFNIRVLYSHREAVFVTEGIFDALSIIECGEAAIALNSTGNVRKLIEQLEKQPPTIEVFIICMDNDKAGKKAEAALMQELRRLNISAIAANVSGDYKDANEALTTNKKQFENAISEAAAKAAARPDLTSAYIDNMLFLELQREKDAANRLTGFSNLDQKSGGLYAGLYVIAATSSLGKTTFALQMADNLAAAGHEVLFFSMEQSRLELVTKSFSRILHQNSIANISAIELRRNSDYYRDYFRIARNQYITNTGIGKRMSIIEGNFNCNISFIGEYIRRYIKRTGARPTIFIDYLQILQPATDKKKTTTKETIDSTITELKRISRENGITVIVISSVNRANYMTPIDFESLKESGGIEYTADVIYGLQLQCLHDDLFYKKDKIGEKRERIKAAKRATPREIELVCLKNRYGISNFTCDFEYMPQYDYFLPAAPMMDTYETFKSASF